jgi:hypothetical protein
MITAPLFGCQKKLRNADRGLKDFKSQISRFEIFNPLPIRIPQSFCRRPGARRQFFTRSVCAPSSVFFAASAGRAGFVTGMK